MSEIDAERNKALVLKAFDTLFNKRDYATAERFGLPNTFSTAHISRTKLPRNIRGAKHQCSALRFQDSASD